jgi:hypothetical protein
LSPTLCSLTFASAALLAAPAPPPEIDNVAAFARLYGVVRFFYPSDAAARLDWNRFAVYGARRVREARSAAELESALEGLVAPLGPGIEISPELGPAATAPSTTEPLVAWRYLGPGFGAAGPYRARRTHRSTPQPQSAGGFATLMQSVPAEPHRGKAIRLRALVRAASAEAAAGAALWLRVDRSAGTLGFFDNMADRLVREPEWRSYGIEGTVAEDATKIAFGVMAMQSATADFDGVELAVKGESGAWEPVPVPDADFEDEAREDAKGAWLRAGSSSAAVSRPAEDAPQGARYLRLAPAAAGVGDAELFPEAAPQAGTHVDVDLGSGLRARVPLVLKDSEARPDPTRAGALEALRAALVAVPDLSEAPDLDQRLADVVVAWSVFRHFYPYWAEVEVDWDARLGPSLEAARSAQTRPAQREALLGLVAGLRDGHGFVADGLDRAERGALPVTLAVVEGQVAVVSSALPAEAPVGAIVTAIDGIPTAQRLARELALASGTDRWREVKAMRALTSGVKGGTVKLELDSGSGPTVVSMTFCAPPPLTTRPAPLSELTPGVFYVDLTRAKMAEIAPRLEALASARGVVFDVRGYPEDGGYGILPHLLDAPESDRWMHVAKIVGPFHETAGWNDFGWDLEPAAPRISAKVVFLTDGSAISYAESVLGYVADRKLGTIVGSSTAGANGNVASFVSPGGFRLGFTGMRVTRHDGRSPHHLVGVTPDVPAAPTLAGLRAGRDEVLERGLAIAGAAPESAHPRP